MLSNCDQISGVEVVEPSNFMILVSPGDLSSQANSRSIYLRGPLFLPRCCREPCRKSCGYPILYIIISDSYIRRTIPREKIPGKNLTNGLSISKIKKDIAKFLKRGKKVGGISHRPCLSFPQFSSPG